MKVILSIGQVRFLTTATQAAKVAEMLGEMKQVDLKFWESGEDFKSPDYKNGYVSFIYGDGSMQSKNHIVEITQRDVSAIFPNEAQADEFIATMKDGGEK